MLTPGGGGGGGGGSLLPEALGRVLAIPVNIPVT